MSKIATTTEQNNRTARHNNIHFIFAELLDIIFASLHTPQHVRYQKEYPYVTSQIGAVVGIVVIPNKACKG
jgi:hypothetical protein